MSKQIKLWLKQFPFSHQTIQSGCLFNQLVYCMAIFTNKTSEDIYCFYYIMPIPCNNMVNSIENANIRGSYSMLWYPAVIRLTPVFVYRDKIWNVGFILSKLYSNVSRYLVQRSTRFYRVAFTADLCKHPVTF